MGKRLDMIKVENNEENRRQYRSLLMSCDQTMGNFNIVFLIWLHLQVYYYWCFHEIMLDLFFLLFILIACFNQMLSNKVKYSVVVSILTKWFQSVIKNSNEVYIL